MKRTLVFTLSSLSIAALMTACSGQMPTFGNSNKAATAQECEIINKKLIKVDNFISTVNGMSAFHLEEAASAIPKTDITTSNNKKTMLKDADRRKAALLKEQQRGGCKPQTVK